MSDFEMVRIGPGDHELVQSRLDATFTIHEHDRIPLPPLTPASFLVGLTQRRLDRVDEEWVAVEDGEVVGLAPVHLQQLDNTHNLQFNVKVRPDKRGKGIGTALTRRMEARAAELGRTNLTCYVHRPAPDGPDFTDVGAAFAAKRGYANALTMDLRVCDLDAVDDAELERLWTDAWAKAEGFELVLFEGEADPELLEGIAYLHGRIFSDSPTGDWDVQEIRFDAERLRDEYRIDREKGTTRLQAAVVHTATGEVAGVTEIQFLAGHETSADQGDTIVDPRHRGHRLGTILKIANQRRVRGWRPRVRHIWTGNAQDNAHMIAINEAIGYRRGALGCLYQKRLA